MSDIDIPAGEEMEIAVRAFAQRPDDTPLSGKSPQLFPSEWIVLFDTETTTDASQRLRFGTYQVRKDTALKEEGVFYDPKTLTQAEQKTLKTYAGENNLTVRTAEDFVEKIFFGIGYRCRARILGFNLPFDISRLALECVTARPRGRSKMMQNGFSFKLSKNPYNPRIQVKHVSSRNAFFKFTAPKEQRAARSERKKGLRQPINRGFFIDVKTLAAALTSKSYSLKSLAEALDVEAQKYETEEHGRTLTPEYIAYAVQDTRTTWACFQKLGEMYDVHGLKQTQPHQIHSEASLGKAYLKDMGIKPWRIVQHDFPPELLGYIMSTYYGGRSEVHIRREITQVRYCDFRSMYPTVCTLMGLWEFVTAQGMEWRDTITETQNFLENITPDDLQRPETWRCLHIIVQVQPDGEIFPVRGKYEADPQYTIGVNHLTSKEPLWYTLADCIGAKILTGRSPKILKAITFTPKGKQKNLQSICIGGNSACKVNPTKGDFFKQVIEQRIATKERMKKASGREEQALNILQGNLKILANSTSYGIFVELNIEEEQTPQDLLWYGVSGKAVHQRRKKVEVVGTFFHPLLATLITSAARLMLAITERLAIDAGLDWAFCDTDSMALAKPENMTQKEFAKREKQVREWFTKLSPYEGQPPLLEIEEHNFSKSDKKKLEPLYCFAISAKRYALFNLDDNGKPSLRKGSGHGLGHLFPPYKERKEHHIEDEEPWQQDFWLEIISAELEERYSDFSKLENFHLPAASRYSATTPRLLKWFNGHNEGKDYRTSVKPFNFLFSMQAHQQVKTPKPVSPFNQDITKARYFDRETGNKVRKNHLKTYLDAVAPYPHHAEIKFLNGDSENKGRTQRRHIVVTTIRHIGKEANQWEEQFYIGLDPDAQIEYGQCPEQKEAQRKAVLQAIKIHGAQRMADAAKVSVSHAQRIQQGKRNPTEKTMTKLFMAAKSLEAENKLEQALREEVKVMMREKRMTQKELAEKLGVDSSNLSKLLSGKRYVPERLWQINNYLKGKVNT